MSAGDSSEQQSARESESDTEREREGNSHRLPCAQDAPGPTTSIRLCLVNQNEDVLGRIKPPSSQRPLSPLYAVVKVVPYQYRVSVCFATCPKCRACENSAHLLCRFCQRFTLVVASYKFR